jgi:lysozyme
MNTPRLLVTALSLSAAALVGLVAHEGYSDRPIIPVPGDVLTIGFGTTEGVKATDKTTPVKALQRAMADIQKFEGALKQCVKVPLYQHEYDTYINFSYNIGSNAFCNSTLVKKLNAQDYEGACKELLRWNRVKGRVVDGLSNRRQKEYKQCLGK